MSQQDVIDAAKRYEPYTNPKESLSSKWEYIGDDTEKSLNFYSYSTRIARLIHAEKLLLLVSSGTRWSVTSSRHLSLLKKNFKEVIIT